MPAKPDATTLADRSWSLVSSQDGLDVVSGSAALGWSTVASLRVAGVDSRQWVGQGCLLRGTNTIAAAFGPVEYIDKPALFDGGGFAAVVDLNTGAVRPLPVRPTFSYFDPACGQDGTATFTTYADEESRTRAVSVTAAGHIKSDSAAVSGEVIGATDTFDGETVGILGTAVVALNQGHITPVHRLGGSAHDLHGAPGEGLVVLIDTGSATEAHYISRGHDAIIADARRGDLAVDQDASGGLTVHGASAHQRQSIPSGISVTAVDATAHVSPSGKSFITMSGMPRMRNGVTATVTTPDGRASAAQILPDASLAAGSATSISPEAVATAATTSATTDANLPCAIQRNDPSTEAFQPTAHQVEWAVDQAIYNRLTVARPAGYRGFGLPAYSAQGLFPLKALTGGGRVPAQIMLGILANESNLWQASSHVTSGGYGNPLTGNIYGRSFDSQGNESLTIDFTQADCGYGVAQDTDSMRKGQMSGTKQRAVALDYQANIADGLDILISKWNQLKSYSPAITMNDGSSTWIENWYLAAWAYNSGLQPNSDNGNTTGCTPGPGCTDSAGNWGLGWANNPANPDYLANRHMFNSEPNDPTHPQDWPYQERVIGWAAFPIYEADGSYAQAWWTTIGYRAAAIPAPELFCTVAQSCTMGTSQGSCNYAAVGPLQFHCWTHVPIQAQECTDSTDPCGHSTVTYGATDAEPTDAATADPSDCASGPVSGAVIVDDIPASTGRPPGTCHSIATTGSFAFRFTADGNGNYPAHIDLHQINGGLNGHYWFTHTDPRNDNLSFTGTWTFPTATIGPGHVFVHMPALGAQTPQAQYTIIDGATGTRQTRIVHQDWGANTWVDIGSVNFTAGERIQLTSLAPHDHDSYDVAFDAVAFSPQPAPTYRVVSLGDSYTSGETVAPYFTDSDFKLMGSSTYDACHRSTRAYPELLKMPGQTTPLGQTPQDDLAFLACSGAETPSITTAAVNSSSTQENPYKSHWGSPLYAHGEALQADAGYLTDKTDVVTIGVGGDDARFGPIVQACYLSIHDCDGSDFVMKGDTQPLITFEPHVITDLLPSHLLATYEAIHQRAPNAAIFVAGYPLLFPPAGSSEYDNCNLLIMTISQHTRTWFNQLGNLMSAAVAQAVSAAAATGINIHYVDVRAAFTGHDACSGSQWIRAIYWQDIVNSFHPTAAGQAAYARLISAAIAKYVPAK